MISVIIPNWNGKRFLGVCFNSLRKQTYKDFEIILVDNGSKDGSVSFIQENFPEVIILQFKENRGFSAAVNAGIRESKGKYIALLNNDTEADPKWLEELKEILDGNPEVGFCGSKILFYDRRDRINSVGLRMSVNGSAGDIGFDTPDNGRFDERMYIFGACAAAAIYRKSLFQDVGFFDEDFFAYAEDVDISFRFQLRGNKCLYVPTAVVFHRWSGTALQNKNLITHYIERNLLFNYIKNMPIFFIIRFPLKVLRFQLYSFWGFLLHGKFILWLMSRVSVLPYILKMLDKRREIQRNRRVPTEYLHSLLDKGKFQWF
jgi:GT2 family glycosyltransferase